MKPAASDRVLNDLLRATSRSFYLSVRVLPKVMREPVGIAYLLARSADSIADSPNLSLEQRRHWLTQLHARFENHADHVAADTPAEVVDLPAADAGEQALLRAWPVLWGSFLRLSAQDQQVVAQVVATLITGMLFDQRQFAGGSALQPVALADQIQLERYTYLVAGCVGEFWTHLLYQHIPALADWPLLQRLEQGRSLGQALQLTNILRDWRADLRLGRCYFPQSLLQIHGLNVVSLQQGDTGKAFGALRAGLSDLAMAWYRQGLHYVLAVPRRSPRLRLAALWPILIGVATLDKMQRSEHSDSPVKVTRGWVYRMLLVSTCIVGSNVLLSLYYKYLELSLRKVIKRHQP